MPLQNHFHIQPLMSKHFSVWVANPMLSVAQVWFHEVQKPSPVK